MKPQRIENGGSEKNENGAAGGNMKKKKKIMLEGVAAVKITNQ